MPTTAPPVPTPLAVAQVVHSEAGDPPAGTRQPDAKDTVADAVARPASELNDDHLEALGFDDDGLDDLDHPTVAHPSTTP